MTLEFETRIPKHSFYCIYVTLRLSKFCIFLPDFSKDFTALHRSQVKRTRTQVEVRAILYIYYTEVYTVRNAKFIGQMVQLSWRVYAITRTYCPIVEVLAYRSRLINFYWWGARQEPVIN